MLNLASYDIEDGQLCLWCRNCRQFLASGKKEFLPILIHQLMFGLLVGWLRLRGGTDIEPMSQLKDVKERSLRPNRKDEVRMPDLPLNEKPPPLPERFQGFIKRKRNGVFNVKHKCFGVLSGGILKLRSANERSVKETKLSCEYVIELDKIHVYYNDRKRYIKLQFLKEAHLILPVSSTRGNATKELFEGWKGALLRHRHYRQGQIRLGKRSNGEDQTIVIPSSLINATKSAKQAAAVKLATPPRQTLPSNAVLQRTQSTCLPPLPSADDPRSGRPLSASANEVTTGERTRRTEDLRRDIHELLGTLKRTHETIKHSLAHGTSDDEADSSNTSSDDDDGNDSAEVADPPSPAVKSIMPADGHRNLEETMSTTTAPPMTNNGVDSTLRTSVDARPTPINGKPFVKEVGPAVGRVLSAVIKSPPVTAQSSDSVLRDVYNAMLELKQVYDDLKGRMVKPSAGGSKTANRLADAKVCATLEAPAPPLLTLPRKTKANGGSTSAALRVESPVVSPKQIVVTLAKSKEIAHTAVAVEEAAPGSSLMVKRSRRTRLPVPQIELAEISYSSVLKGRLPIWAYEPLGALQVMCEELRFASDLLGRAVTASSAAQRMAYVAAFAVSGYATIGNHKQKPFNPLRGETFDYVSDCGWLFHAEQVSHHPPISASNASHPDWEWHHCAKTDARFTLSGVGELTYKLPLVLTLHRHKEVYTYNKVKTIVINPMKSATKRIIRQEGMLKIECTNGLECRLLFSNCAENTVKGGVYENRKFTHQLIGNWDKGLMRIVEGGETERLFDAPPVDRELADRYYGMTPFSVTLNELHAEEAQFLPPTDSRFRPDQRFLEAGDPQRATNAKLALEKSQRKREYLMPNWQPMWFQPVMASSAVGPRSAGLWRCNGKYWESRALKFQDVNSMRMTRDIFKI